MRITNRERIISASIQLFNQRGVAPTTTNHICQHLGISPGNLYFHFANKEAILRELFATMCQETYAMWKLELQGAQPAPPLRFIEATLEIFWKYRMFHREMYALRRIDPKLNEEWHRHLRKTRRFMKLAYVNWTKAGYFNAGEDPRTALALSDNILVTGSSFFSFLESAEKPPTRKPLQAALQHLAHLILPYVTSRYSGEVKATLGRVAT